MIEHFIAGVEAAIVRRLWPLIELCLCSDIGYPASTEFLSARHLLGAWFTFAV